MRRTITIELKYDADELHEIMRQASREAARTLLTAAILVCGERQPVIAVRSDDFFDGTEDISIHDEEEPAVTDTGSDG